MKTETITQESTIQVRPGWLISDVSSATGGIKYHRTRLGEESINDGAGIEAEHLTKKTVDHVEIVKALDATTKEVDYVLRKHCAATPFGRVCPDELLSQVKMEVAKIAEKAAALNEEAKTLGSRHRAYIGVVPTKLDLSSPEAAREIARTVHDVLCALRDALREGRVADMHKLKLRSKNLHRLATGFQADAIRFALERVPGALKELKEAIDDHKRAPESAGRDLDLEAIEAAIAHFDVSDEPAESAA